MHSRTVRRLNKEQILSGLALAIFSAAFYGVMTTGPQDLAPSQPHTMQSAPKYVAPVRPSLETHGDATDLAWVRHNPFAPERSAVANNKPKIVETPRTDIVPAIPVQNPEALVEQKKFPPIDLTVKLNFAGVIVTAEKTVAMITEKGGEKRWKLSVGDYIPEHACTVTRIEKQSIILADDQQRTFVLLDGALTAASEFLRNAGDKASN